LRPSESRLESFVMGDAEHTDADERIIDRFLAIHAARREADAEAARALLLEMYPSLGPKLEIVAAGARRVLVRRAPAR
jgi:hypothetical protein